MSPGEVAARRVSAVQKSGNSNAAFSVDEESALRRHHEQRILRFTSRLSIPDKVAATAITYFKRFFLGRSVLDYNPSLIALSAMYAACKVEEVILSADDLVAHADAVLNGLEERTHSESNAHRAVDSVDGTAMSITTDMLLNWELQFLNMLRFHLICYHPYRSLLVVKDRIHSDPELAVLRDKHSMSSHPDGNSADSVSSSPAVDKLIRLSRRIITGRTFFTDMQFIYSPSAIAIASVICAAREIVKSDSTILSPLQSSEFEQHLLKNYSLQIKDEILALAAEIEQISVEKSNIDYLATLERRRKKLCVAQNDPTTELFQELERRQNEELEEKRLKKAQEQREIMQRKTAALMGFDEPA